MTTRPGSMAATVALILALAATVSGCGHDPSPEQRLTTLDHLYQQGTKAAQAFAHHGIVTSPASCEDMWKGSGLAGKDTITDINGVKQDEDKVWQAQRHTSYLNGCLGRSNDITATTPTPNPTASSS